MCGKAFVYIDSDCSVQMLIHVEQRDCNGALELERLARDNSG